jgi:putative oxidoreductase
MESTQTRLWIPALAPLYRRVSDLSYPLIRIAVGAPMLVHGVTKLMGGPAPVIASMARNGFQPAEPMAYLIIFLETIGALCIILGLFTRFFAAALFIESLVIAFAVQWPNGFSASHNGYEMVLTWAIIYLALALRGGGPWSLDRKLGREL